MKRKALGRGLGALIPSHEGGTETIQERTTVRVDSLFPNPHQPRKHFDEDDLEELAASIREAGLMQPILVSPVAHGYQIIAGERRWRAVQLAGLSDVPVVIREVTEREALALAMIENLQRVDLNPIEEAEGYRRLADDFELTQEEVARAVGKDRSSVTNLLRLLKLEEVVLDMVRAGKLSMGHARVLVTIQDPRRQIELARLAIAKELSVRQMEALGRASSVSKKKPAAGPSDPNVRDLLDQITRRFGTKVQFAGSSDKGKIILEYYSSEEFDRLVEQLLP